MKVPSILIDLFHSQSLLILISKISHFQVDAHKNPKAYVRLTTECEKLKKLMSANSTAIPLNIECFMDDKDVSGKMKRDEMEQLAAGLLQRFEHTLRSCLENSGIEN